MDRTTELDLIDELMGLKAAKSAYLDEAVATNPVGHYSDEAHFEREQQAVFRTLPVVVAHVSELAEPGAFKRASVGGLPVLVTRDKAGEVHAFLNVCRHRGTRLVDEDKGCKHKFSCPYHAWTYASDGRLVGAPHLKEGFPEADKKDLALKSLKCAELYGFIWVSGGGVDIAEHLAPMHDDLVALDIANMHVAVEHHEVRNANWKILVEGGIEAYHFRVAHRTTIGPHFEDNLSSYRMFGAHMRSVLPRTTMGKLQPDTRETWRLRDHANVLYTLFPNVQMLVQQDHIVWISSEPLSAGKTKLRLATLVPNEGPLTEGKDESHWQRNHAITRVTLDEDFVIGESIQEGLSSGANDQMTFGRFEGALDAFNRVVLNFLG